jgi:23S rRNA pseudouridine955/2504/2580 synthase
MSDLSKEIVTQGQVSRWDVDEGADGQRLDNFLAARLKGVPKAHIYRIVRSGEVRVNSRRCEASQRLNVGDSVRVPPVRTARRETVARPTPDQSARLLDCIVYQDDALLVLNKPAGWAVHGGSSVSLGVIEALRHALPQARFLELAHRLDRDTSGLLMVAKKRSALTALHDALREGRVEKRYLALVKGKVRDDLRHVRLPLVKFLTESGERRVSVDDAGKPSHTIFRRQRVWTGASLVEAELKTGRTHQIRVHLASIGHPILGDDKYGDFELNKRLAKQGVPRLMLHAARLCVAHPLNGLPLVFEAPVPKDMSNYLARLDEAL